jgi:hypothetical protein
MAQTHYLHLYESMRFPNGFDDGSKLSMTLVAQEILKEMER